MAAPGGTTGRGPLRALGRAVYIYGVSQGQTPFDLFRLIRVCAGRLYIPRAEENVWNGWHERLRPYPPNKGVKLISFLIPSLFIFHALDKALKGKDFLAWCTFYGSYSLYHDKMKV